MDLLQYTASLLGGSGQCNSCNTLPHCLGAVGSATPAIHCLTALGGSGQWNSCNTLPHCLGAVGSGPHAIHRLTAWGQWAVDLLQYTAVGGAAFTHPPPLAPAPSRFGPDFPCRQTVLFGGLCCPFHCRQSCWSGGLCCAYCCYQVWCGVVWCGVVWCAVVWCGVVWCGVVWCAEGAVTKGQKAGMSTHG